MGLFKSLFSGLNQMADDDVNGIITAMIACLIDEDNYNNYRKWFVAQILGNPATPLNTLSLGIYTTLMQQVTDKERQGLGQAIDDMLWKIRQGEISI